MATINEMLANSTEYGAIGGMRQAQEDQRTAEKHMMDIQTAQQDLADKQAKAADFLAARESRNTGYNLKAYQNKEELRREKKYSGLVDAETALKLKYDTQNMLSNMHSSQVEDLGRFLGDIKDEKTYQQAMSMPGVKAMMSQIGIDPNLPYAENKPKLGYVQATAVHNLPQHRELEQLSVKNLGAYQQAQAAAASHTRNIPPGTSKLFQGQVDLSNIASQLVETNEWSGLKSTLDMTNGTMGTELQSVASQVMNYANGLIVAGDKRDAMENTRAYQVSPARAISQAIAHQRVMMTRFYESGFGTPKKEIMNAKDYSDYMLSTKMEIASMNAAGQIPNWAKLSPDQQRQIVDDQYERYQTKQYEIQQHRLDLYEQSHQ